MRVRYTVRYPAPVSKRPDLIPTCPVLLRPVRKDAGLPVVVPSEEWNMPWASTEIQVDIPDDLPDSDVPAFLVAEAHVELMAMVTGIRPPRSVRIPRLTKAAEPAKTENVSDEPSADDDHATVRVVPSALIPLPAHHAPPEEEDIALGLTERYLPRLRAVISTVVRRPFQIVLSGDTKTSATDCRAVVYFNPKPLEEGRIELALGRALHEAGHLRNSRGSTLMERAHQLGGEKLGWITNIGMDRKDDAANAAEFPGFAPLLWKERGEDLAGAALSPERFRLRPKDAIDDFYYATKLRRRPRTAEGRQARAIMRAAIRKVRAGASDEALLEAALRVEEILAPAFAAREQEPCATMRSRVLHGSGCENGGVRFSPEMHARFQQLVTRLQKTDRERAYRKAPQLMRALANSGTIAFSGEMPRVERKGEASPEAYAAVRSEVQPHIQRVVRALKRLGHYDDTFVLHGLDEGELDRSRIARIAVGAPDIYLERVNEFVQDAEVHLVVDESGSMQLDDRVQWSRRLGVLFNEAILACRPDITGHLWGFSDTVMDYGPCRKNSGIAGTSALNGTNEAGALLAVGRALRSSKRSKRAVIVVGDGGSNDPDAVKRIVHGLTRAGVLAIRLLIDVIGAPQVYPVELPFSSFEESLGEFDRILASVLKSH